MSPRASWAWASEKTIRTIVEPRAQLGPGLQEDKNDIFVTPGPAGPGVENDEKVNSKATGPAGPGIDMNKQTK